MDPQHFFLIETPAFLKDLNPDAGPRWGAMNPSLMLDHLRRGIDMCLEEGLAVEIVTPAEHLPSYKAFLMSGKNFKQGSPQPMEYDRMPVFEGDWEELKMNLMKSVVRLLSHFENHPDFTAVHPNFGELNTSEWLQLHKKHFQHHFRQFGLIPE